MKDGWSRYAVQNVLLDGEDVTKDCFEADDEEGYVLLYLEDEDGRRLRRPNGSGVAQERRAGRVEIVWKPGESHDAR